VRRNDFYFDLPKELIAQTPLLDRTASRLLILDRVTGAISHKSFADVLDEIAPGDCLVINETKVIPARLFGERKGTGAKIEILLLNRKDDSRWEALVKPGKRAKVGDEIVFGNGILQAEIESVTADGNRILRFDYDGIFEEILDALGEMPLPPYITEKLKDKDRYQTVYAKHNGSAAAPTAGLHFTHALLQKLTEKGVHIAKVTLHVGLGTFRPVKAENILEHKMHSESYEIDAENAAKITNAKKNGGRIFAVGTTSLRTLESVAENGEIKPCAGDTDIFIYPGYKFKIIDGLITNFHLPESTLIMLVSALCGRENVMNAYQAAIDERYRFFSFGDAMLIL
jgi:S-adenosylmethionine:tRNA ribosyltransferase-isomerase